MLVIDNVNMERRVHGSTQLQYIELILVRGVGLSYTGLLALEHDEATQKTEQPFCIDDDDLLMGLQVQQDVIMFRLNFTKMLLE